MSLFSIKPLHFKRLNNLLTAQLIVSPTPDMSRFLKHHEADETGFWLEMLGSIAKLRQLNTDIRNSVGSFPTWRRAGMNLAVRKEARLPLAGKA